MSLTAEVSTGAAQALKDSKGSGFDAIPAGTYDVTITEAEVVPFAKQGVYANKKALNVKLRIVEDSAVGAKRTFYYRVPLFDKFAPSQKNPQGASAFGYFGFFGAIGVTDDDVVAGNLPDIKTFLGKRITASIKFFAAGSGEQSRHHVDKESGEEIAWNEVNSVWASKAKVTTGRAIAGDPWAEAAPTAAPAKAADPWAPDVADVAFAEGKSF